MGSLVILTHFLKIVAKKSRNYRKIYCQNIAPTIFTYVYSNKQGGSPFSKSW